MSEQVVEKTSQSGVSSNGKANNNGKIAEAGSVSDQPADGAAEKSEAPAEPKAEAGDGQSVESVPKKKRRLPIFIVGGILIIAAIGGLIYWLYARQYESTDDAFIEANVVQVSPKVTAYITKIYVRENQVVHKGDLLVDLDPKDYEAKLEQAKAQLLAARAQQGQAQASVDLTRKTTTAGQSQARANIESARNNVIQTQATADSKQSLIRQAQSAVKTAQATLAQTRTQVPQAQANLNLAQTEFNRRQVLFNQGDISKQSLDQATTTLQTAQAQLDAAQKQVDAAASRVSEAQAGVTTAQDNYRQAQAQVNLTQSQVGESQGRLEDTAAAPQRVAVNESQVGSAEAQIAQAEAVVHQAELDLSYTKIYAPDDGVVTKKAIQEGQLVQPGASLLALSQSDDVWVVANFKETQLEKMRVGQPVDIKVDAYPNEVFHAKIDSFQPGTGSRFSVLPAENATGNYVKVVQRIPVKIVFDESPDRVHLLAPGMSVEPSVKIR
jgi:membrane fusion protein (multidrug efflux system)